MPIRYASSAASRRRLFLQRERHLMSAHHAFAFHARRDAAFIMFHYMQLILIDVTLTFAAMKSQAPPPSCHCASYAMRC